MFGIPSQYSKSIPTWRVDARMRLLLADIERSYDFHTFSLSSFRTWIEERRQRRMVLLPYPLPPRLFGCWLRAEDKDYVFYEEQTAQVHQAHIQLHEMCHIVCGHETLDLSTFSGLAQQDILTFLAQAGQGQMIGDAPAALELLLRTEYSDEQEREAEALSDLVQHRVEQYRLHHRLMQPITFSKLVVETYHDMGWA